MEMAHRDQELVPRDEESDTKGRVYRKISDAPSAILPLLRKVVEDILDGLKSRST